MKPTPAQPGQMECLIGHPSLGLFRVPAVATSLDRRGAVVHLQHDPAYPAAPETEDVVEVVVGLPPHAGEPARRMHCQARIKHRSMDRSHRLWLVLQFFQIQFEAPETAPGPGRRDASPPEDRRGDRDPAIVGRSQPGATPQPNQIEQGE